MVRQTRDELVEHLREQSRFLDSSAWGYDSGEEAEAKRLARVIRTLAYDTRRSRSLLGQLERKDSMLFSDTAVPFGFTAAPGDSTLAILSLAEDDPRWEPRCQHPATFDPPWTPFSEWWEAVVIRDAGGREFTRGELLLLLDHKDGGGHVDPELPEGYAKLSRENSMEAAIHLSPPGGGVTWEDIVRDPVRASEGFVRHDASNGPELASVRQIAHEMRLSLDREFPALSTTT